MKNVIGFITLAIISSPGFASNTETAETNVLDKLLEKLATSQDSRISQDVNKHYLLEGINPEDGSNCRISLKSYEIFGGPELGYSIGIRDLNPNTSRINNPVVGLDIQRINAHSSGGESKIVEQDENFIEIRTSSTIPYWASYRSGAELNFDGLKIEASAYFNGGLFSRSDKYYEFETEEDVRKFFSTGHYSNYGSIRPSDEISCDFEF